MKPVLIHQLLERSARVTPEALAVVDGDNGVTYRSLDRHASQLANALADSGVQRGDRVALFVHKSAAAIAALYGILKAGGVYVPLDSNGPVGRAARIADDAGIRVLVSSAGHATAWKDLAAVARRINTVVVVDGDDQTCADALALRWRHIGPAAIAAQPGSSPPAETIPLDLSHLLYTSGTTGNPKGVMLTHLNTLWFVEWAVEAFEVTSADRLSSHAPLHFDLATFDLFAAAAAGAAVVLVPRNLSLFPIQVSRFIDQQGITIWYSVPMLLTLMALRGGLEAGSLPRLRRVLFAGEVFPKPHLARLMHLLPHATFTNLYGPTETNVCTWYEVDPASVDSDAPTPIGRPLPGLEVFAIDDQGIPVADGEVAELCIRGPTVMAGYWADPDRSAQVLIRPPHTQGPRDLAYRSGDLARRLPEGDWQLVGRRDNQIKSRGYRIELGEIESAILTHPSVEECAVVAIHDEMQRATILCHLVAQGTLTVAELITVCEARLPDYMLPDLFVQYDALPRTSTDKVDRQALLAAAPCVDSKPVQSEHKGWILR